MGHTILFTHLKIILLQYFLVFNFQFQFSVVSKPTLKLHSACLDSAFFAESRVAFFHFFFFFLPSFHAFCFFFSFFFFFGSWTVTSHVFTVHTLKNIKNGSHDTIHVFKNYFVTILSVFSFSNNKLNPNGPYSFLP